MPEIMDGLSMDIERANMDKLKVVFPECFAEGKLDIDKLLSLCGEYIDNDFEKYKFEWKGKAECLKLAQKRSAGTLRPCPEESVNFDTTQNLYIEGDNLEVLKLLQTAYYRKVKMIYIDPPYNTGNDFVYADDFADPIARYKEVTQQTTKSNPETMGRFHTNWLNMMYPRLRLAANLLRDDGVIFISIGDNEVANLRKVCDEVFGEENFRNSIIIRRGAKNLQAQFDTIDRLNSGFEYILMYSKNANIRYNKIYKEDSEAKPIGTWNNHWRGTDRPTMRYELFGIKPEKGQWRWAQDRSFAAIENYKKMLCDLGTEVPTQEQIDAWYINQLKDKNIKIDLLRLSSNGKPEHYIAPSNKKILNDLWDDIKPNGSTFTAKLFNEKIFDNPKSVDLLMRLVEFIADDDDDIVLDFFSGSATTAHAVMQLNAEDGGNRRFICVQLPELCDEKSEAYKAGYKNICEIGKERIRRAGAKILAESTGQNKQIELGEEEKPLPDIGFRVFKLDTSNLKTWDNTPVTEDDMQILLDRMNGMIHRVKSDRSDMDMVCEIMLKLGVPLTNSVKKIEVNGKTAYTVGDDCLLLICLAENVQPEDVEAMAEYAPAKVIIARDSFADDTAMANAHYILRDRGIELKLV